MKKSYIKTYYHTSQKTIRTDESFRAVLSRFDMVAIYFAVIFATYGAGQLSSFGWVSIPVLIFAFVTFLVPCALVAYELGTHFPVEGGMYIWAERTFGRFHGFASGWLSWVPVFLILPLDANVVMSFIQYLVGYTFAPRDQVIVQVVFVLLLYICSLMELAATQRVLKYMFGGALFSAVIVCISGLMSGGSGMLTSVAAQTAAASAMSVYGVLASGSAFHDVGPVYAAAVLWLLGVEVPFNMSGEYTNHKETGRAMLVWGSLAVIAGYILGIVGILLVLDGTSIDQTLAVAHAAAVVAPLLGTSVAVLVILSVFAQGLSVMNSYARLPFVASLSRTVSTRFAARTATDSPYIALGVQAILGVLVILFLSTQQDASTLYSVYLASLVALWCASLFYMYGAVLVLRMRGAVHVGAVTANVWSIPGGAVGLLGTVVLGVCSNVYAIYSVFSTPWVSDMDITSWAVLVTNIMLTFAFLGVWVYIVGTRSVAR